MIYRGDYWVPLIQVQGHYAYSIHFQFFGTLHPPEAKNGFILVTPIKYKALTIVYDTIFSLVFSKI
jgi:hypothetical protein